VRKQATLRSNARVARHALLHEMGVFARSASRRGHVDGGGDLSLSPQQAQVLLVALVGLQ
jgi:hypothetical protein